MTEDTRELAERLDAQPVLRIMTSVITQIDNYQLSSSDNKGHDKISIRGCLNANKEIVSRRFDEKVTFRDLRLDSDDKSLYIFIIDGIKEAVLNNYAVA